MATAPPTGAQAAKPLRGVENPAPTKRRLRVYAFDPGASVELDTAGINDAVIELPWENPWEDGVTIGPTNDYLEVIDYDFPSQTFYEPLDLNDSRLLAQDGLPLSEGRPQFHQQMVFAVAMKTVLDFERALGRAVFWSHPDLRSDAKLKAESEARYYPDFIKRLRIYPHAMRAANAYYSPAKAALLFGYFKGEPQAPGLEAPWVFTALSQDIIAHETTHAILHGMRRRSVEASNEDSLAFHEAFADIIALLQHFTMRRVVEHELTRTGGVLRSVNLLTGLAQQFGRAIRRNGALRQALETLSEEQRATDLAASAGRTAGGPAAAPPPAKLSGEIVESHERGGYLVAAIFDAFVRIYERRTADLFRIAGITPGQPLPERLAARLAEDACKAATSIMQMCVRGLDYLPPVSSTFGEYLRAIITADTDLYPDDPFKYRVAVAESFSKRGIAVPGCLSYAPESLLWEEPDLFGFADIHRKYKNTIIDANKLFSEALGLMVYNPRHPSSPSTSEEIPQESKQLRQYQFIEHSDYSDFGITNPNLRDEAMRIVLHNQRTFQKWLDSPDKGLTDEQADDVNQAWEDMLGIRLDPLDPVGETQSIWCKGQSEAIERDGDEARRFVSALDEKGRRVPKFEVHSVRVARRRTPEGRELQQLIVQVTQKRWAFFDRAVQAEVDLGGPDALTEDIDEPDFWFRGGATIIVDLRNGKLTHVIRKRIDKDERLEEQRRFILGNETALAMAAEGSELRLEPFCFLHGGEG
ncbi:MAG: hypothetical protein ABIT04_04015 [Novosphingobium sp.]